MRLAVEAIRGLQARVVMRARCEGSVTCFHAHAPIRTIAGDMLTETVDPQLRPWPVESDDHGEDRIMLAIQYATAIIAALAAGFLSLVR